MRGKPPIVDFEAIRRYPVWEVAKVLGHDGKTLLRRFISVGWAVQELPFPRSQWIVPVEIMETRMPEVKKKLDSIHSAGIPLTRRCVGAHKRWCTKGTKGKIRILHSRGEREPDGG